MLLGDQEWKGDSAGYVIAQSPGRVAPYYMGTTSQFPLGDLMLRTLDGPRHKVLLNRRDLYAARERTR